MQLTIRISEHAMSFSKREADSTISHEPYHMKSGVSTAANLRQAFNDSHMLAEQHRSARVLIDTPVLVIPADECDNEKAEQLYAYTYGEDKSVEVMTSMLESANVVVAFAVNRDLKLVLDDNFKMVTFLPLMLPVWQHLHADSYKSAKRKMYAYLHGKTMELVSFRQNHIVFCNRFDTSMAADAVYYTLNAWQQLGMKPSDDLLDIIGTTATTDKYVQMAGEFVSNVAKREPSSLLAEENTQELPFDLLALYDNLI